MWVHLLFAIIAIFFGFLLSFILGKGDIKGIEYPILYLFIFVLASTVTGVLCQKPTIEDVNSGKAKLCTQKLITKNNDTTIVYSIKRKK